MATRCRLPKPLMNNRWHLAFSYPLIFSNKRAGPPFRITDRAIPPNSRFQSTSLFTRTSSPIFSQSSRKALKSLYGNAIFASFRLKYAFFSRPFHHFRFWPPSFYGQIFGQDIGSQVAWPPNHASSGVTTGSSHIKVLYGSPVLRAFIVWSLVAHLQGKVSTLLKRSLDHIRELILHPQRGKEFILPDSVFIHIRSILVKGGQTFFGLGFLERHFVPGVLSRGEMIRS